MDSNGIKQGEQSEAGSYLNRLASYDIEINVDWGWAGKEWVQGLWTLSELEMVLKGVQDIANAIGSADRFKAALGGTRIKQKKSKYPGQASKKRILLSQTTGFDDWTVVHELAHVWDLKRRQRLSKDMQKEMGAGFSHPTLHRFSPKNPSYWYDPGKGPPPCGIDRRFNRLEDFAEAVTAYVYPERAERSATDRGWPYVDPARGYSYADFLATPRGKYIQALMAAT